MNPVASAVMADIRQRMVEMLTRGETLEYGDGEHNKYGQKDVMRDALDECSDELVKALRDGDGVLATRLYKDAEEKVIRDFAKSYASTWIDWMAQEA